MPETHTGAGRLVPASQLDFSRSAKNLAWLLEVPLHLAQALLAQAYGYADLHELQASWGPGDPANRAFGPFDAPRARPLFGLDTRAELKPVTPNFLARLSPREQRIIVLSERLMYGREDSSGRLRRRHFSVLDCAFFSAPSQHRKAFAEVKSGILAVEGSPVERERYLERHWPPAFWSYLEISYLLRVDARAAMDELKDSSVYFDARHILDIADLMQQTAAFHAPRIFLAMVGEDPEPGDYDDNSFEREYDYWGVPDAPAIAAGGVGLFDIDDGASWSEALSEQLTGAENETLLEIVVAMTREELLEAPPPGTPAEVLVLARKWRLRQLRFLCRRYAADACVARRFGRESEVFWPDSPGNTITEVSDLVWTVSREEPSLWVQAEFAEADLGFGAGATHRFWRFKALLTRTAPEEQADVVGYMVGWLIEPADAKYVSDESDLREAAESLGGLAEAGTRAFLQRFLPYQGYDSLLTFVNSTFRQAFAPTEIVLRPKYRGKGLGKLALEEFASMAYSGVVCEFPQSWLEVADFELNTVGRFDHRRFDGEPDIHVAAPHVLLIPVEKANKKLVRYLTRMDLEDSTMGEPVEVFPLWFKGPRRE